MIASFDKIGKFRINLFFMVIGGLTLMAVRGQLLRIGVGKLYIYVLRGAIGGFVLSIAGKIGVSIARQLNISRLFLPLQVA